LDGPLYLQRAALTYPPSYIVLTLIFHLCFYRNGLLGYATQARTGRGIHGLPKVSPRPAMPNPYTPCGRPAAVFFPLGYPFPYGPDATCCTLCWNAYQRNADKEMPTKVRPTKVRPTKGTQTKDCQKKNAYKDSPTKKCLQRNSNKGTPAKEHRQRNAY
jgi:hypothetical protein